MIKSLYTAATGMQAQSLNIDVIANNLANASTTGFKGSRADFQDLIYETARQPGAASAGDSTVPTGVQIGHGTKAGAVSKLFSQGEFQNTKNELDMAIEGNGFFQVTQPDGEIAYSRAGSFKLDGEGRIVTTDGFLMEPEITVPADTVAISIGLDGTVAVKQAGSSESTEIGTLTLARFVNPAGLSSSGRNLYAPTEASGDATYGMPGETGFGTVLQGYLEKSNVDVVKEMIDLIVSQRSYEINSKAVKTADELLAMTNNLKR